jgi:hypothetical protein
MQVGVLMSMAMSNAVCVCVCAYTIGPGQRDGRWYNAGKKPLETNRLGTGQYYKRVIACMNRGWGDAKWHKPSWRFFAAARQLFFCGLRATFGTGGKYISIY